MPPSATQARATGARRGLHARSQQRVDHFEEGKLQELRVCGHDLLNAVLPHQNRRRDLVKEISSRVVQFRQRPVQKLPMARASMNRLALA